MSFTTSEEVEIFTLAGVGKAPYSAAYPLISQTISFEMCNAASSLSNSTLYLTAIHIPLGVTITNITLASNATAESGGTHLWYALYDDGRGSATPGQLALLGQTADQTSAVALAGNTVLTLPLFTPWVTQYSGIYYIGFACTATTRPGLFCGASTSILQIMSNMYISMTVSGASTGVAPNPSGSLTANSTCFYAYVS